MIKIFLLLFVVTLCIITFYGIRFYRLVQVSKNIVASTVPYSLSGTGGISLLVIGDSTAVGVGATKSDESIAGRLAHYIGATRVENHGVSGAVVEDLRDQVSKIQEKEYDYILLQIGANDMTSFHDLDTVSREYEAIIASLPKHKTLIVTSCGNLGGARIFPLPLAYIYEHISQSYHVKFASIVNKYNGLYIDLFEKRSIDPFVQSPDVYLATDSFHPSSAGYALWFSKIEARLKEAK